MKLNSSSRVWIFASGAVAIAILIGLTTGIGVYVGNRLAQNRLANNRPPIELNAGTAARTKTMSMATGRIDNEVEGLFVLDHVSGNLQCWVLNPQTGQVGGVYRVNVLGDVAPTGKAGAADFVMTTGDFFFSGGKGTNQVPGQTVCYVGDADSGHVVGYGVVYDKQAIRRGAVAGGVLQLICKGVAREQTATRDQ